MLRRQVALSYAYWAKHRGLQGQRMCCLQTVPANLQPNHFKMSQVHPQVPWPKHIFGILYQKFRILRFFEIWITDDNCINQLVSGKTTILWDLNGAPSGWYLGQYLYCYGATTEPFRFKRKNEYQRLDFSHLSMECPLCIKRNRKSHKGI